MAFIEFTLALNAHALRHILTLKLILAAVFKTILYNVECIVKVSN